ncbi:hypothetical protein AX15_007059 [Amanita polypyramis BW_CC]|nr:hypothetical protein AX15_007059 [Amanita polypyramis BW_CC]
MVAHRPPPLQLKYDNFRLSVPSPAILHRRKSFFQKLYRVNWRKAVVAVTLLNGIRFFLSASNAFQDAVVDHVVHHSALAGMSLIICLLYLLVALIETFGMICVLSRRFTLTRAYTYLAFVSALFVTAAGVMAAVMFFGFADEVINECASLATQGKLHLRSTFQGQPWPIKRLSPGKAHKICLIAWTHESSFQAASFFICTLLPAALSLFVVYTYYRQVTDPTHKACLVSTTPRTSNVRMEGVTIGPNRGAGSYQCVADTSVTSSREDTRALGTQRRRGQGQGQAKEAKGLLRGKQSKKSESFTTSQKKRLAAKAATNSSMASVGSGEAADVNRNMVNSSSSRPSQVSPVMNSTSPYKMTPGPPSYAGARGVGSYGPRLDAYSAGPDSWRI